MYTTHQVYTRGSTRAGACYCDCDGWRPASCSLDGTPPPDVRACEGRDSCWSSLARPDCATPRQRPAGIRAASACRRRRRCTSHNFHRSEVTLARNRPSLCTTFQQASSDVRQHYAERLAQWAHKRVRLSLNTAKTMVESISPFFFLFAKAEPAACCPVLLPSPRSEPAADALDVSSFNGGIPPLPCIFWILGIAIVTLSVMGFVFIIATASYTPPGCIQSWDSPPPPSPPPSPPWTDPALAEYLKQCGALVAEIQDLPQVRSVKCQSTGHEPQQNRAIGQLCCHNGKKACRVTDQKFNVIKCAEHSERHSECKMCQSECHSHLDALILLKQKSMTNHSSAACLESVADRERPSQEQRHEEAVYVASVAETAFSFMGAAQRIQVCCSFSCHQCHPIAPHERFRG